MFLSIAIITIGSLLGAYIFYILGLYRYQDNLIFFPAKVDLLNYRKIEQYSQKLQAIDGATLQGWTIHSNSPQNERPLHLLYFGGNAQEASAALCLLRNLDFDLITTFNYRGYGLSSGSPREKLLYSDALEIYDWIDAQFPASNIIVMGHSLGSAIAGHLAKQRRPEKIILSSPLHSLEKIAKEKFFVPGIFVRHKFSLYDSTKLIESEVLALIAKRDSVIPNKHSYESLGNISNLHAIIELEDVDHNSLICSDVARAAINHFIDIRRM
ncbi:alpha/beta hydrolase [Microbulbifer sp. SA54]|uniref:alpha/beta hydrolase n=1 Tax=Microbulbifer sp. SA54 TaxID=3401577 RepID=UPI003AAA67F4